MTIPRNLSFLAQGASSTGVLGTANGGTNLTSFTVNGIPYATSTSALNTSSALQFNGSQLGINTAPATTIHAYGATNADQYWDAGGTVKGYIQANTTNGYLLFGTLSNHDISFWSNSAARMRLFASGGVSIGNTTDPGAGNLRFNTTGTNGIYFGSSSILTDYETGTWTPTPSGVTTLSGTPVWTGTYTKVGRLVTIIARMTGGNIAITNGGTSKITNLPYSATNDFWGSCGDDGAATTGGFVLTGGVILYFCTTASYTGGYFSASVTYTSS